VDGARELIHATAIALGGKAALIRGPSGSGKSDLALRCLALAPNTLWADQVRLVSDDQVTVTRSGVELVASAPATIAGRLEIRGIGIVAVPFEQQARVGLVVDLVEPRAIERMPDPADTADILGVSVALMRLAPWETSAAVKLITRLWLCPL
jgi:serine kinase of HPr protein (carbohydrate metabolism regulator)